ncbi:MAG: molybdopterin-dependent oxidoreductase [Beijerinckiaceae bacterium]
MSQAQVKTTCPYCGVGCGIIATLKDGGSVAIKGDPDHPANFGRLCTKGAALGETVSLDGRLLHPAIGGRDASWDEALDLVASRFVSVIREHGPDSVGFYVSGQILTEDYYVANKLMKGFIGSANIDTNSRLCMASSVAGHKRAFGSDTVPGTYEDLEIADLVVLTGSNLAWCHPVLWQRLLAARERKGTKIVVIDPRATAVCEHADLHLALKPGTDVAIFNGLLAYLAQAGAVCASYVAAYTNGLDEALRMARSHSLAGIAATSGLTVESLLAFYELFVRNERSVTVYSQGVNQSTSGTDKVNAIINCHLATGRIGRPGMGPFSVTGQPNAMGGREVGGLATMLAAHMDLSDAGQRKIVKDFWNSPAIAEKPGLKAVDMFDAVYDGRIKAVWIMGTNPVVSMPDADFVKRALERCDFVVVSDVVSSADTLTFANVALPSLAWGEKSGTVTNSERRISRQRPFLQAPANARADWRQMCEVAKRMGFEDGFNFDNAAQIFAEYAALSGSHNWGSRDFDISAWVNVRAEDYESMTPWQWPQPQGAPPSETRFFADGKFYTPDRKARFVPVTCRAPAEEVSPGRPLLLNTGRMRDQWHTMTRTARSARLMKQMAEPVLDMHPEDAAVLGLAPADIAVVSNERGKALLRVRITTQQQAGAVYAPMHWTAAHSSAGRINALTGRNTDPHSGQPELKVSAVAVHRYDTAWYGFAATRAQPAPHTHYWARSVTKTGWQAELADCDTPENWTAFARRLLGLDEGAEVLAYHDASAGNHRFAAFEDDMLVGLFFAARSPVAVSRVWAAEQIGKRVSVGSERLRLLAGRSGSVADDPGAAVCTCFDVGLNQIQRAVATEGCDSIDLIRSRLGAGGNCGSCRGEIQKIIDANRMKIAAE